MYNRATFTWKRGNRMGYISTTHYFFVNYDNDQKRILVNNNLISDEYLSLEEFKRKCWEQILLNGYFHYTPVPNLSLIHI